jgi:ADP-heptose:LPS heptosyltransferase
MSRARRVRRRANRRFYRCLFRLYRTLFPTPRWVGPLDWRAVERVLVIRDDRIGDMVLTTPLLSFLRDKLLHAEIDVLASPSNAPVVERDPRVARVLVHDRTWSSWLRLLPRARARGYDLIVNPITRHPHRQGLVSSLLGTRRTYKVSGWRPVRFQGLFTKVFRVPPQLTHVAESTLAVGQLAFGERATIGRRGLERYPVQMSVDSKAVERVAGFLSASGLDRFVLLNTSAAGGPWREWPPDQAAEVVRQLLERPGALSFVVVAAPGKEDRAATVARLCAHERVVVAPAMTLQDLVALVSRSSLVLTTDTALVHLASATGRPVVALYAPQHPNDVPLWLPVGVPYRTVVSSLRGSAGEISPAAITASVDDLIRELEQRGERRQATTVPVTPTTSDGG